MTSTSPASVRSTSASTTRGLRQRYNGLEIERQTLLTKSDLEDIVPADDVSTVAEIGESVEEQPSP